MGNRATVIFWNGDREKPRMSPSVYLHWNGGPESVYSFLEELDRRNVRADQDYECARFIQLVGEFFDFEGSADGLSLGIADAPASDDPSDLDRVQTDHGDNGFYLVCRVSAANPNGGPEPFKRPWLRRFTEARFVQAGTDQNDWGNVRYCLIEWTSEDVERERAKAETHEYRQGLRETYAAIQAERDARKEPVPA